MCLIEMIILSLGLIIYSPVYSSELRCVKVTFSAVIIFDYMMIHLKKKKKTSAAFPFKISALTLNEACCCHF